MNVSQNVSSRVAAAVGLVVLVLVLVLIGGRFVCMVPAGHVGVVTTFGRVHEETLPEGLHLIAPWNTVQELSIRTAEIKEEMDVPTKEGVTVRLEASLLYSLESDRAAEVYQKVGPDFVRVIVEPQFRSATRGTSVNYEAKDLYTGKRSDIEHKLETETRKLLEERGIRCERVMLRKMELPPSVKASIDQKLVAEQKSQQMTYELETARQEAEKKLIEAEATARAQETIKKTLDDTYIRYLWVQALETAAKNRAATIYVPTGADGLPLVGALQQHPVPSSGKAKPSS